MAGPRKKIASIIAYILERDSKANISVDGKSRMQVRFFQAGVYDECLDLVDVPVVQNGLLRNGKGMPKAFIIWDITSIGIKEKVRDIQAYQIGSDSKKRERRAVTEQEKDIADLYGGQRHIGSGAIADLKSDSSGKGIGAWQVENKSTKAKSFSVTLSILNKITVEAKKQTKHPMLQIRFLEADISERDWFLIPRSAFVSKMRRDDE